MNKSITKEIVGLVEVSKHVGWGVLNHHVLRAHRVLWLLESHGVARSRRNVLRTTSSIGAVWMKFEVSFKPLPLRSFASQGLLIQNNQMSLGKKFLSDMCIASTLVAKLSVFKLMLCDAFPTVWVSLVGNSLLVAYQISLLVAHQGYATTVTPLVSGYRWRTWRYATSN